MSEIDRQDHHSFPWTGCGSNKNLAGCRFSLYPLDSRYQEIILGSLNQIDTSKVWKQTDALSTVYRGNLTQVFDCLSAVFIKAYQSDLHLCLEAQVSQGCPGDVDTDSPDITDEVRLNRSGLKNTDFFVKAKLALYPLGLADYLPDIAAAFHLAEKYGLNPRIIHYATRIEGPVLTVFDYLEEISALPFKSGNQRVSHQTLHFTISVGSPTTE
ncbi:MAG: Ykof family thiamine-binding protein [Deltaproteobacteria bacterium]|jgi:uncharacterized protein YqgV (UPF0045/DUF77 family)|nr:Ykof family thiamine-binding protein [Deltaproteobacteria bacterium]